MAGAARDDRIQQQAGSVRNNHDRRWSFGSCSCIDDISR